MSIPALSLSFRPTRTGDRTTLAVAGDVDLATADQLENQIATLADDGCRYVVVDLSEVGFCDCRGLAALAAGHARIREHEPSGWLRLAGPQPVVAKLLRLTHFADLLGIYDTVTDAQTAPADRGAVR